LLLFQQSKTNTLHTTDLLMCKLNTQAKKIRQHHTICSKWPQSIRTTTIKKQQLILKWIMIPTTLLVRGCQCRFMITSQVHESLFPTVLIYPLNFVSNPREHSDWNCVCDSVTFGAKRIVQGVALEFLLSRVIQGRFIVETLLFSLGNWPRYKTNSLLSWQFVFRSWCELEGSLQERIARPTKFVARNWRAPQEESLPWRLEGCKRRYVCTRTWKLNVEIVNILISQMIDIIIINGRPCKVVEYIGTPPSP